MIAWLKGKIVLKGDHSLVIDVGGVGYELFVSAGVLSDSGSTGNTIELTVYTDVKENAISLFGFVHRQEKEVFLMLKKVKGVGSKLAMNIISSIGSSNVLQAIGLEDISSLTRVSGVGKKSAERIIVELREQVVELVGSGSGIHKQVRVVSSNSREPIVGAEGEDAVLALEKLGFAYETAKDAVAQVLATNPAMGAGEILRKALATI